MELYIVDPDDELPNNFPLGSNVSYQVFAPGVDDTYAAWTGLFQAPTFGLPVLRDQSLTVEGNELVELSADDFTTVDDYPVRFQLTKDEELNEILSGNRFYASVKDSGGTTIGEVAITLGEPIDDSDHVEGLGGLQDVPLLKPGAECWYRNASIPDLTGVYTVHGVVDMDDSYDGSDQNTVLTVGDYAKEMSLDFADSTGPNDVVAAIYLNMGAQDLYPESAE